ncbi:MAG: zinc-ribbon domain-containing protein [Candidatus Krumholzibacteriales bacterium]
MIVACEGCETRYKLPKENIPEKDIRVRCPKCSFIWRLLTESRSGDELQISRSGFEEGMESGSDQSGQIEQPDTDSAVEAAVETGSGFKEITIDDNSSSVEQEPAEKPEMKKEKERAKRLARVFVSDILVYNREKRDKALAEGKLIQVLGPEIKKGWEAYKKKVGPEIKEANIYFKEALNNILAEGEELF